MLSSHHDYREMTTSSPWCQRWRHGHHSWRHRRDGGFDARRYDVRPVSEYLAKSWVVEHHYSHSYPAAVHRYGLYDITGESRLAGVAVFGLPTHPNVLRKPLPTLEPYHEALLLARFVLDDVCPANSESWFLARCFSDLVSRGVKGIVTFADPVPRRDRYGSLVMPGHVGTIYAASNATYTGRGTARTKYVLPSGAVLDERAAQKVRTQERGHVYVERLLISLGATAPRAGQPPKAWLDEALLDVGARKLRHRGAHRYVFRLGCNRRDRDAIVLALPGLPYPKLVDPA